MIGTAILIYFIGVGLYAFVLWSASMCTTTGREKRDIGFVASFVFVWPVGILVGMWLISYRLFKYGRGA